MKNILVTGGVGFIGTNLITDLVKLGYNVTSLDDYSAGLKTNEIQGAKYVNLDIELIDKIGADIDICFHLAAKSRVQPSFKDPREYFRVIQIGPQNILQLYR